MSVTLAADFTTPGYMQSWTTTTKHHHELYYRRFQLCILTLLDFALRQLYYSILTPTDYTEHQNILHAPTDIIRFNR